MAAMAVLMAVLTLFLTVTLSAAVDRLTPQRPLLDDDGASDLVSAGGKFQLGFFSPDGSSDRYVGIWYHSISKKSYVWVANRDRPVADRSGRLSLMANGTLVISGDNFTIYWSSSNNFVLVNPVAQLLDNANFVVGDAGLDPAVDPNSYATWQSFDLLTNTLLPGMKLGWNLSSGLNRKLTSWASDSDPATGNYTLSVDLRGDPQVFVRQGTQAKWRSGPWNGLYYSGVPQMQTERLVEQNLSVSSDEVVHRLSLHNPSVILRQVLTPSGEVHTEVWSESTQSWSLRAYVPMDPCESMSPCGSNAACDPDQWPRCKCLPGFHPKNPINWEVIGNTSDGCVRNTTLDCRNGTDGFSKQHSVKLPDTSTSSVNRSMTLAECEAWCSTTCSCTAYAASHINGSGSPSGCIIWTSDLADVKHFPDDASDQDPYVRLAAADLVAATESIGQFRRSHTRVIAVIVPLAATFLLACVAGSVWLARNKKSSVDEEAQAAGEDLDLPLFDLSTIADATANFSISNKLGEGGFGPVYMGRLREGQEIAVKRLSKTSTQGAEEFKNEVMLIAKLQHRNLVRLLGCCIRGGERMLVYEYMPNGSLDAFLFDKVKCALLDWRTRYNIILGVARGLLYIHHDSRYRIIHRDLKTSNILLDKDMNPKISDFGMAKLFGSDEAIGSTKRIAGTYGYMSPEYAMNGIFSVKSDVFSFGVLVLETVTCKRNNGVYQSTGHQSLLVNAWSLWKENRVSEAAVDDYLGDSFASDEILRCIKIGLLCVQERAEDRPTMSSVLLMLNSNSSLLPEPKRPGFIVSSDSLDTDSSPSKSKALSINQISITVLEGR